MKSKQEFYKEIEQQTGREHRILIHAIVDDLFLEFNNQLSLYKKYNSSSSWDASARLEKDFPEIFNVWKEFKSSKHPSSYDKWLFNHCFGDVIDD